jgi:hypothetical protein
MCCLIQSIPGLEIRSTLIDVTNDNDGNVSADNVTVSVQVFDADTESFLEIGRVA